jgi:uncharacterized membrane protein YkoI
MKVLALLLALAGIGLTPMTAGAANYGYGSASMAAPAAQSFSITRGQAAQIALRAVGGGQVLQVQFDDYPRPIWQVEVLARNGGQYEVNISVRTGRVLAIIYQGNDG